jgi:hypothetical protein
VVCDNVSGHRGKEVQQWLKTTSGFPVPLHPHTLLKEDMQAKIMQCIAE